jgi:Acetyltransferase (GNAT) domain
MVWFYHGIRAELKCARDKCEDAPVTVTTQLYSDDTIPQTLTWQALSFLRCEWPFLFAGDNRLRTRPFGGQATTYVVQADGEVLLSYAEVLRVTAVRACEPARVLGLSNVFTFPPYRAEGHASAIMRAVAGVINTSDAELAILFCEKELEPFYAARGWRVAPVGSIQAPGTAPLTMARAGPALSTALDAWLSAAPVLLPARW